MKREPSTWDRTHLWVHLDDQHRSVSAVSAILPQLETLQFSVDAVMFELGVVIGSLAPGIDKDVLKVAGIASVEPDERANAIIAEALANKAAIPMRVRVWAGDGTTLIGDGTYVADVPVHFMVDQHGNLRSSPDPEDPVDPATVPAGWKVVSSTANPKIIMDVDGRAIYGCQCYWQSLADVAAAEAAAEARADAVAADAIADALRRVDSGR